MKVYFFSTGFAQVPKGLFVKGAATHYVGYGRR